MIALRIALRYLFSHKSHNAVNVISLISVAGVAVATLAIVVVLSVFNGFTELANNRLSLLDPQLRIQPASGKVINNADSLAMAVRSVADVSTAIPTIDDQALAINGGRQMPVHIKGVPTAAYDSVTQLKSVIIDGEPWAEYWSGASTAVISIGVANNLAVIPGQEQWVGIYTPRRTGRINPANPMGAFRTDSVAVSAVYRVDQAEYDADYLITDISTVRRLLDYTTQASSVEVALHPSADTDKAIKAISAKIGPDYVIKTRLQQQEQSYKMISVEKWVTFLMLAFILIIASFNIISTLSLLIIEKEDSISTLRAMGASTALIRRIIHNRT
ncbi:MAG: ABC transporter permease, partial [Muribaculaceae bacterium]|nr:ABC transporter permease [Muribaculaceae bacterium]